MPTPRSCKQRTLASLMLAATLTACATAPQPLPVQPRKLQPMPAALSEHDSQPSQDYSAQVRAFLNEARTLLNGLTPK